MENISIVKEKKGKMSKKRLLIMVLTLTGIMAIVSGLIILLVLGNSTPPEVDPRIIAGNVEKAIDNHYVSANSYEKKFVLRKQDEAILKKWDWDLSYDELLEVVKKEIAKKGN